MMCLLPPTHLGTLSASLRILILRIKTWRLQREAISFSFDVNTLCMEGSENVPTFASWKEKLKPGGLTNSGRVIPLAATRGAVLEVDRTVVGPQAAIVEGDDVVKPVGEARDPRGLSVRRGPPVVPPIRRAAPNRVSGENLDPLGIVAALLPGSVSGAVGEKTGSSPC